METPRISPKLLLESLSEPLLLMEVETLVERTLAPGIKSFP